jgi:hypothetical protein
MNNVPLTEQQIQEDIKDNFRDGFLLVLGAHAAAVMICLTLEHFHAPRTGEQYVPQPLFLYLLGISQLAYILPMALVALIKAKKGAVKGMFAAAALTFLLNAAFCGLMMIG